MGDETRPAEAVEKAWAFAAQHQGLLPRIAKRYFAGCKLDYADLFCAALPALYTAARDYDETRGKFGGFAGMRVRAAMKRELQDHSRTIRVPVHTQEMACRYLEGTLDLDRLGPGRRAAVLDAAAVLEAKWVQEDAEFRLADAATLPEREQHWADLEWLRGVLILLPDWERLVIVRQLGLDGEPIESQRQIAKRYGWSHAYVQHMLANAVSRLRELYAARVAA